jgi:hypothetical protein
MAELIMLVYVVLKRFDSLKILELEQMTKAYFQNMHEYNHYYIYDQI